MPGTALYASCRVGDLLIGIDVDRVREVAAGLALTPVPLASPLVGGLLNLRGDIITAIDLRRCLRLPERPAEQRPVNVVLQTPDGWLSLLVDEVGDVLTVDPAELERPPATLPAHVSDLISGVYTFDGRLLLALNTDGVLAVSSGESVMSTNGRMTC